MAFKEEGKEKKDKLKTKSEEIDIVLEKLEKDFGVGTVIGAKSKPKYHQSVPTGSLGLDRALGIGGLPRGRIVEFYGPESSGKTTMAIHVIAEAHKTSKTSFCAFVDAEHAFDTRYAENIGVDLDRLIISQPDYGEQALEVVERLAESGQFDVIVVDSVAALVPKAEVEREMGESSMGKQAMLMSQAMRKLTPVAAKSNTLIIFLNQLREKIGIMFGCFPYTSRVKFWDGTSEKIGNIVNNKIDKEVISYNPITRKFEPKKIINWFQNGKYGKLVKVTVPSIHKSGKLSFNVADDHSFITKEGDKKLSEMKEGDKVLTKSKKYLNHDQRDLVIGGYLGDGSIRTKNSITFNYREAHSAEQNDYCKWKAGILNKFVSSSGTDIRGKFWFDTHTTTELEFLGTCKNKGLVCISDEVVNKINGLSLAIWYLDDGSFSGSYKKWGFGKSVIYCKNMQESDKTKVKNALKDNLGLEVSLTKQGFLFSGENCKKFQETIARFVPNCMNYKLHPSYIGRELYEYNKVSEIQDVLVEVPILKIEEGKSIRSPFKYDIQIEDNSNYMISDILVHNSPETTPGGNALKYYASVRLDIRRSVTKENSVMDGEVKVGNQTTIKVVKNKTAPPYRSCVFDILYGIGVDKRGELIEMAVETKVIGKSGSFYSYEGKTIGQGMAAVVEILKSNNEMFQEIKTKVMEVYTPKQEVKPE